MDQASPLHCPNRLGTMNGMDLNTPSLRCQADLHPDNIIVRLVPIIDLHLQRTISIRRGDVISIGRSSHDIAKGLLPETDNALFDCPVVSRKHAELVWRTEKEKSEIIIVDHGSSHGTFVNGAKLKRGEDFLLKSGDQVRLGCEINSHMGSHDGITFDFVHVEVAPTAPTGHDAVSIRRGFCLYGDEESTAGSVVDDDDDSSIIMEENQPSSNHTTPDAKADQATARPGSQNLPIDLEQPNLSLRHIIDVDDEAETACPRPATDLESRHPANEIHETQPSTEPEPEPSFFASWFTGGDKNQARKSAQPQWDEGPCIGHLEEDATSAAREVGSASDEHEYDEDETSSDMFDGDGNREKNDSADLVSESCSVDEGPERMSSKKRASPELGCDSRDMATSLNTGSYSVSGTLHYDPVRGSQPPASSATILKESMPKPRYTYGTSQSQLFNTPDTDLSLISRWDVAPAPQEPTTQFTHHSSSLLGDYYNVCSYTAPSQLQHYSYPASATPVSALHEPSSDATPQAFNFNMPATYASVLAANLPNQALSTFEPMQSGTSRNYAQPDSVAEPAASNIASKKRKADEMSQDESLARATDIHAVQDEKSDVAAGAQVSQSLSLSTAANTYEHRKAKRAKTAGKAARSIVRAAGKVIGYTALGGIATAYFLQSPVAEALCEWL